MSAHWKLSGSFLESEFKFQITHRFSFFFFPTFRSRQPPADLPADVERRSFPEAVGHRGDLLPSAHFAQLTVPRHLQQRAEQHQVRGRLRFHYQCAINLCPYSANVGGKKPQFRNYGVQRRHYCLIQALKPQTSYLVAAT